MGAGGAATGAAVAAAINAIKASGVVVRVSPADFIQVISRTDAPLVVVSRGGVIKKHYRYLTSYKGLAFFARSPDALVLPPRAEIVGAEAISIPEV